MPTRPRTPMKKFLSTPSARRATGPAVGCSVRAADFYPRPPRGGRPIEWQDYDNDSAISIHALREEGDRKHPGLRRAGASISIHALREEGDRFHAYQRRRNRISIHALREEGDAACPGCGFSPRHFYPRPPRGGRPRTAPRPRCWSNFYPRPPRGGRRWLLRRLHSSIDFYPRPPRGGRPPIFILEETAMSKFLSTPSARRATGWRGPPTSTITNFYPRPPRGGRPVTGAGYKLGKIFLSTPSARRATRSVGTADTRPPYFYPRPPRGGRPSEVLLSLRQLGISIHALREEGDRRHNAVRNLAYLFLSTPSARRATLRILWRLAICYISIHALREEGDLFTHNSRCRWG